MEDGNASFRNNYTLCKFGMFLIAIFIRVLIQSLEPDHFFGVVTRCGSGTIGSSLKPDVQHE
jgi:hypothetical protein